MWAPDLPPTPAHAASTAPHSTVQPQIGRFSPPREEYTSERSGAQRDTHSHNSSSTPTTPTFSVNGRHTPSSTSIDSRPSADLLQQEHPHPLASPFSALPPPSLGRFPYPHPHPFMNLHYSPFLHPRPEYYPPLNLAAHGVSAPLHALSHHNNNSSPSPVRESSLSSSPNLPAIQCL